MKCYQIIRIQNTAPIYCLCTNPSLNLNAYFYCPNCKEDYINILFVQSTSQVVTLSTVNTYSFQSFDPNSDPANIGNTDQKYNKCLPNDNLAFGILKIKDTLNVFIDLDPNCKMTLRFIDVTPNYDNSADPAKYVVANIVRCVACKPGYKPTEFLLGPCAFGNIHVLFIVWGEDYIGLHRNHLYRLTYNMLLPFLKSENVHI